MAAGQVSKQSTLLQHRGVWSMRVKTMLLHWNSLPAELCRHTAACQLSGLQQHCILPTVPYWESWCCPE